MAVVTWQDLLDRSMASYNGRQGPIVQNPVEAKKAFTHFLESNAKAYAKLPKAIVFRRIADLINGNLADNNGKFVLGPGKGLIGVPKLAAYEWGNFIKKYPDFPEFLQEEYPNRIGTGGPNLGGEAAITAKNILRDENISAEEKWKKIGGQYQKQARYSFLSPSTDMLKGTISTEELAPYTNFKYSTLKDYINTRP